MKIGAKTLRNNFRMKETADEVDVTTKPGLAKIRMAKRKAKFLLIGGKGKR